MRPARNGVTVLDYAGFGPYQTWEADEWECPTCKHRIVVGFGNAPSFHHNEDGFQGHIDYAAKMGSLRPNREAAS